MTILDEVNAEYLRMSLPIREARNISLACVLEPLSEKKGCTTRTMDIPGKNLEMFLSGGVNIFPAYYNLTEHLLKIKSPEGAYKFFHQAILLSKMNRKGGQINSGILEFSFPIFMAHVLDDPENKMAPKELFYRAKKNLEKTSEEDFHYFMLGKRAAQEITLIGRGKTYVLPEHKVSRIIDYYEKEFEREKTNPEGHITGMLHNRQFVEGFPDLRDTYEFFEMIEGNVLQKSEIAYNQMIEKNPGIGPGLVADFIATSIYLHLSYNPEAII